MPLTRCRIFLSLLALYAAFSHFYETPGGGARIAMTAAIVEDGSLEIDRQLGRFVAPAYRAVDSALVVRDGRQRRYSDKAPLTSLVAIPTYAAAHLLGLGVPGKVYLVSLLTTGVAAAATGVLLFELGPLFGARGAMRLAIPLLHGAASHSAFYATHFSAHALTGLLLLGAFALLSRGPPSDLPSRAPPRGRAFLAGLLAALAVTNEYSAAAAALVIGLYGLWRLRGRSPADLAALAAGAGLPALAALAYNWALFGHPLSFPYAFKGAYTAAFHSRGILGVSLPSPAAALELLVGERAGLLVFDPVLLVALPCAGLRLRRDAAAREPMLVALAVGAAAFLLNAGIGDYSGGATWGPRYLVAVTPFLFLTLAAIPLDGPPAPRRLLAVLAVAGFALSWLVLNCAVLPPTERGESGLLYAIGVVDTYGSFNTLAQAFLYDMLTSVPAPRRAAAIALLLPLIAALSALWRDWRVAAAGAAALASLPLYGLLVE